MLHTLPSPKTNKKGKRIGRGRGTGVGGHTTGGGMAGATIRSGYKAPRQNFEGGQNPLSRRLPKYKGFSRGFATSSEKKLAVQLSSIEALVNDKKLTEVTEEVLIENKLIKGSKIKTLKIKVVFDGEVSSAINLKGLKTTTKVKETIEKAGGKVE